MGDDDKFIGEVMKDYLDKQVSNNFDLGKDIVNNEPEKMKIGHTHHIGSSYYGDRLTEQMMRDSMEVLKNDMYKSKQKSLYERTVEKTGKEPMESVIGDMHEIANAQSKIEVLMVLIDRPSCLTYTGFLDKNPYVHECLQDGFLERRCDQGTHYYIVTKDGRLAVDMEHL